MPRPSSPLISHEAVVEASLRIIDREGLDAFSLPRLARELNVQAPSLYHHFQDRADILRTVARAIVLQSRVPAPAACRTWVDWFVGISLSFRRAVLSHRNAAPILLEFMPRDVLIWNYELGVQILAAVGVPPEARIAVIDGLDTLTLGASLAEAARSPARAGQVFANVDADHRADARRRPGREYAHRRAAVRRLDPELPARRGPRGASGRPGPASADRPVPRNPDAPGRPADITGRRPGELARPGPPRRHERTPPAAEFRPSAAAQSGQEARQDIALLTLEMLGADRHDGPDRPPPRRRSDGLRGCVTDDLADVIMVGERILDPFGGLPPQAEPGLIAGLLLGLGVRYQQVGEPVPYMAQHPAGSGAVVIAGRVGQDRGKTADPAMICQDQLDDVGLPANLRTRDEDVAGPVWAAGMLACWSGHSWPHSWSASYRRTSSSSRECVDPGSFPRAAVQD